MKDISPEHPLKLYWLSNVPLPGALGGAPVICGWISALAGFVAARPDIRLTVLYPQGHSRSPVRNRADGIEHIGFYEPADPLLSYPGWMEEEFGALFREERPDILHLWGTEYVHSLACFKAYAAPERTLVSIQGLISVYAEHYFAGVPESLKSQKTLRDLVHKDDLLRQQKKYEQRGSFEKELLAGALHVAGRTSWDRLHTERLAPKARYHHCGEILREEFYREPFWSYKNCEPCSIFASQFYYPIKGFHKLLLALPEVLEEYPETRVRVSGGGIIFPDSLKGRLRKSAYPRFLEREIRRLGLKSRIEFLGNRPAAEMKREYLRCNVFVLPSAIENSPNSLGEAMLTGTPLMASDVGGVRDMLYGTGGEEDFRLYAFPEVSDLARGIKRLFAMKEDAEAVGKEERERALENHSPEGCLKEYLEAYGELWE